MKVPTYRLIEKTTLNEEKPYYIIERRDWLLWPISRYWVYVASSCDKCKMEVLLSMLRTGAPYTTKRTIA